MAHPIDAEHDQGDGQAAIVLLRPGTGTPAPRNRPVAQPTPLRPVQGTTRVTRKPIWDKDNFGFWLAVCILLSLLFSIVYQSLG